MTPAKLVILGALALAVPGCASPGEPPAAPGHEWDQFHCADANQSYPCREQRAGKTLDSVPKN